jgi:hypothetical protein
MKRSLKYLFGFGAALAVAWQIANAAAFTMTRIAVTFDDQKPPAIVERGSDISAQAELSFTGNGLLKGAWEIAGPNPDGNKPQYRTLINVNQPIAGKDAAVLKGPKLPTESTGPYLVRLRVVEPALSFETPVATYNVIEKKK